MTLHIHRPPSETRLSHPQLVIHLPPGPIPPFKISNEYASRLARSLECPVVSIHYRLSAKHKFPTPIHDALAGYDWALKNILSHTAQHNSANSGKISADSPARIGVTGDLVGGSLALMLALTETRTTDTARIVAASTNDAVVDWVFEGALDLVQDVVASAAGDEMSTPSTAALNAETTSLTPLMRLRRFAFPPSNPSTYFDPFASPIHFLRSPSMPVPRKYNPHEDFVALNGLENADQSSSPDLTSTSSDGHASSSSSPQRPRPRPRPRPLKYPPYGMTLSLPQLRLGISEKSMLQIQTEEFARLVRRAVFRNGVQQSNGMGDKALEGVFENQGDSGEEVDRYLKEAKKDVQKSVEVMGVKRGKMGVKTEEVGTSCEWLRKALRA